MVMGSGIKILKRTNLKVYVSHKELIFYPDL